MGGGGLIKRAPVIEVIRYNAYTVPAGAHAHP
jgi:hypothetical protein